MTPETYRRVCDEIGDSNALFYGDYADALTWIVWQIWAYSYQFTRGYGSTKGAKP